MAKLLRGLFGGYGARRGLRKLAVPLLLVLPGGAALAETVTIAALGDSLTAGYGLAQQDGFVPRLQDWLKARGADAEIVNAGVSGDTTAGGAARVGWTLTPEVDGMIVALGGNDLLRGIDPAVSRANLDRILAAADAAGVEVLLVGLEASGNYGPEFKTAFDAMYPALADSYDVPYYGSFFKGLLEEAGTQERVGPLMQADGIHPNAKGVEAVVAAMGPAVLDLVERAAE